MSSQSHNRPVCIDGRMIGVAATGVTAYAETLRALLPRVTARPMLLAATGEGRSRLARLLAAARPGARRLASAPKAGEARLVGRDIFREAQVHFDLYGRLLVLWPPFAGGIMHWTYPVPLAMAGWSNVYTVHDAIPLVAPGLTPIDPARHLRLLRRIAGRAARLATVSEAARAEIVAALGCAPGLVVDVAQAVAIGPGAGGALPAGLAAGGYLLVCGSVEPRKNIARILDAYRASGVGLALVVAGPDGWRAAPLNEAIAATPGAVRLAWQDRAGIDALIAGARALLMPSLAEGFGLPVVEAMARGVPVVTSDRGALAETAGGAALTVDPASVPALAAALRRIVDDAALRAALAVSGRRRAADFAPERIAPRLAALYDGLIASPDDTAYPHASVRQGDAT